MLLRSIKSNASFLFPRIGLFVVLAWLLWFANSVIQSTAAYLRKQVSASLLCFRNLRKAHSFQRRCVFANAHSSAHGSAPLGSLWACYEQARVWCNYQPANLGGTISCVTALQGAIDNRMASAIITASECSALLGALLILLSMLGVNIGSALLLPAGIAVAIAAKDLSHNWLAGFFLFVAQVSQLCCSVAPTLLSVYGSCASCGWICTGTAAQNRSTV